MKHLSQVVSYFFFKLNIKNYYKHYRMNTTRSLPPQYLENCPIIDQRYRVLFKLGTGRFSKVNMAICMATNQRVAIKIMNHQCKQQIKRYNPEALEMFFKEIEMCVLSNHKNIIKITDFQVGGTYKSPDGHCHRILYYVMKIASNGELYRLIKETDILNQKISCHLFRQLISAVEHLHLSRIAHRDIKSENILIDEKLNLKLADFGCSSYFIDLNQNRIEFNSVDPVGSFKSNAPEVTNGHNEGVYHGDELDLFACGCVLFEMVMKSLPFKSSNHADPHYSKLLQENKEQFWKIFEGECEPSPQFKDLIEKLFDVNPKTRISLEGVKNHPWMLQQTLKKNQFKKQMNLRLKKVRVKVRKEQQEEMKSLFHQGRSKLEYPKLQHYHVTRQIEDKIFELRKLIQLSDHSDSSSCASIADLNQINSHEKQSLYTEEQINPQVGRNH